MQALLGIFILVLKVCIFLTIYTVIQASNKSAFYFWNEELLNTYAGLVVVILGVLLLIAKNFQSRNPINNSAIATSFWRYLNYGAMLLLILSALPTFKNAYLNYKYEIITENIWGGGSVNFVEIYVRNNFLCEIMDRSITIFEDQNKDGFLDLLVDDHIMLYDPAQNTFIKNCPFLGG